MKKSFSVKIQEGYMVRLPRGMVKSLGLKEGESISITAGEMMALITKSDVQPSLIFDLSRITIADVLSFLNMLQKNGLLIINTPEHSNHIYFSSGEIIYAFSTNPDFKIGKTLYKLGLIGEKELKKAEEHFLEGERFGSVLLKKEFLKAKDLWMGLKYQMEEIVFSTFSLRDGLGFFFDEVSPDPDLTRITLHTQNLLMEGFRRMDEWAVIKEKIPSGSIILKPSKNPPSLKISENVRKVLEGVDGKTPVEEIVRKSKLGEFNTYKILYQLLKLGVIHVAGEPEEKEKIEDIKRWREMVEKYNQYFKKIVDAIKKEEFDIRKSAEDFKSILSDKIKKIYEGIEIQNNGTVDAERFADNVKNFLLAEEGSIMRVGGLIDIMGEQIVIEGMNELLNFYQLIAKNLLSQERYTEIRNIIEEARKR